MVEIKEDKRYKYLELLRLELDKSVISILLMNNIVNILLSTLPILYFSAVLKELGISLLISIITLIVVLFGDIIPKSRGIHNKKEIALGNARLVYYIFLTTKPLVKILLFLSRLVNRLFGFGTEQTQVVNHMVVKEIMNRGVKEGSMKSIEKTIIKNVFNFGNLKVKNIYLSKEKVFYISKNYTIEEAKKIVSQKPFTRIPYLENNVVKGILHSKNLLINQDYTISKIIHEPFLVNEEDEISTVFKKMKKHKLHIGIINDEQGNFKGIITLEDIIEKVMGEISDEFHEKKRKI